MKLYTNWKDIIRKAWSIKFIIIAGALSASEVILPLFFDYFDRGTFALLSFVAVSGAFVSRIVAQKDINEK
jgi:hypothetical protein